LAIAIARHARPVARSAELPDRSASATASSIENRTPCKKARREAGIGFWKESLVRFALGADEAKAMLSLDGLHSSPENGYRKKGRA